MVAKGTKMSVESRRKMSEAHKKDFGEKNSYWKGGRWTDCNGYVWIYDGPGKRAIQEHRSVMSNHLGRKLKPSEIVHHKNHDKSDNRLQNLQLMDRRSHMLEHASEIKESYNESRVSNPEIFIGNTKVPESKHGEILKKYNDGIIRRKLASEYGLTISSIDRILRKERQNFTFLRPYRGSQTYEYKRPGWDGV